MNKSLNEAFRTRFLSDREMVNAMEDSSRRLINECSPTKIPLQQSPSNSSNEPDPDDYLQSVPICHAHDETSSIENSPKFKELNKKVVLSKDHDWVKKQGIQEESNSNSSGNENGLAKLNS